MVSRKSVKQCDVLQAIRTWIVQTGVPPTIQELSQSIGVKLPRIAQRKLLHLPEAGRRAMMAAHQELR